MKLFKTVEVDVPITVLVLYKGAPDAMFVYRRNAEQYIALQSGGKWPFIYSPSDFRIEEIAK